jgi:hypothetical protein
VLDAILEAGGLTSEASPCDIILVRPTHGTECRVVLPVCYRQITQIGDVTTNYQLQPGDRIVVGTRTLCEELAVWRQTKSCDRCCRTCGVEREPGRVNYGNRLLTALVATPFPWKRDGEAESDEAWPTLDSEAGLDGRNSLSPENAEPESSSKELVPAEGINIDDSDLFIPPLPDDGSSG